MKMVKMEKNMKSLKRKTMVAIVGLIFSITTIASGISFAQNWGGPGKGMRGGGPGYNQQGPGPGPILRTEMFNARINILADMTDQSPDAIKAKLRYKPMWAVLDEYKVDYVKFDEQMTEKRAEIIKQAVTDGKLTQEHADFMLQRSQSGMGFGKGGPGMRRGGRGQGGRQNQRGYNCPRYNN